LLCKRRKTKGTGVIRRLTEHRNQKEKHKAEDHIFSPCEHPREFIKEQIHLGALSCSPHRRSFNGENRIGDPGRFCNRGKCEVVTQERRETGEERHVPIPNLSKNGSFAKAVVNGL
jgi:hypothetical protein